MTVLDTLAIYVVAAALAVVVGLDAYAVFTVVSQ